MCVWEGSNLRLLSYQDSVLPLNYTRIFNNSNKNKNPRQSNVCGLMQVSFMQVSFSVKSKPWQ